MKFEDLLSDGVFWAAVAALVPLSVAVGSLITLGINAWSKNRNRPEADWSVTMSGYATLNQRTGIDDGIHITGRIANVGDGAAFQVELVGRNCRAGLISETTEGMTGKAFMAPGTVVGYWVEIGLAHWGDAEFDVVWTAPPTRLGKRMKTLIKPRTYMDEPGLSMTDPDTGVVSQARVTQLG